MEYLKTLEEILENLKNLSTLSGIQIILNKPSAPGILPLYNTRTQNNFIRKNNDKGEPVINLLMKNLINYDEKIELFIDQFIFYLSNTNSDLRTAIFNNVKEKISNSRPLSDINGLEFYEFESDIQLLMKSYEIDSKFDCDYTWRKLNIDRLQKRSEILDLLETRLNELEESLKNTETKAESLEENEIFEEVDMDPASVKKLAWLYELGILHHVLEMCKYEKSNSYNCNRAARIISSIDSSLKANNVRTTMTAIVQSNKTNPQHPFHNPDNENYAKTKALYFKINPSKVNKDK